LEEDVKYNSYLIPLKTKEFRALPCLLKVRAFILWNGVYIFKIFPRLFIFNIGSYIARIIHDANTMVCFANKMYHNHNNPKRAIRYLKGVLEIDINNVGAIDLLADIYYDSNDFELALKYIERLLDMNINVEDNINIVNWIRQNVDNVRVRFLCNRILDKMHGKGKNSIT